MKAEPMEIQPMQPKARVSMDGLDEIIGEYDFEGLFIPLGHAIDSIGAKRVVLDTLEALFAGLPDHLIKKLPLPLCRFIGGMSETDRILLGLDLRNSSDAAPKSGSG